MYRVSLEGAGLGQATGTLTFAPSSTTTPMARMMAKTAAPTTSTVKTRTRVKVAAKKIVPPVTQSIARSTIQQFVQKAGRAVTPKTASIKESIATSQQKKLIPLTSTGVVDEAAAPPPAPVTPPPPVATMEPTPTEELYPAELPEPEAVKKGLPTWAWVALGGVGVLGVVAVVKWIL